MKVHYSVSATAECTLSEIEIKNMLDAGINPNNHSEVTQWLSNNYTPDFDDLDINHSEIFDIYYSDEDDEFINKYKEDSLK